MADPRKPRLVQGSIVLALSVVFAILGVALADTAWAGVGLAFGVVSWAGNLAGFLLLAVAVRDLWRKHKTL
jgi:hypothetical protein